MIASATWVFLLVHALIGRAGVVVLPDDQLLLDLLAVVEGIDFYAVISQAISYLLLRLRQVIRRKA